MGVQGWGKPCPEGTIGATKEESRLVAGEEMLLSEERKASAKTMKWASAL